MQVSVRSHTILVWGEEDKQQEKLSGMQCSTTYQTCDLGRGTQHYNAMASVEEKRLIISSAVIQRDPSLGFLMPERTQFVWGSPLRKQVQMGSRYGNVLLWS